MQLHKPPVLIDEVQYAPELFTYIKINVDKNHNPGGELIKVFDLPDKASVPRSKGAILCMKPELSAIDRDNYIVPIWMI